MLPTIALPAGLPSAAAAGGRVAAFGEGGHRFALIRSSAGPNESEVVMLRAEGRPGRPRELLSRPGFDPGRGTTAAFPRIADWCCSP